MSDAADMTQIADDALEHAIRESRAERARIQRGGSYVRQACVVGVDSAGRLRCCAPRASDSEPV